MVRTKIGAWIALTCLATGGAAAADKRHYSLFNPTPDHLLREMSTDRPDATESPFTVDAGRIQIETDLIAYTYDRHGDESSRGTDILPFNIKVGLSSTTDIQLVYGAFSHVRERTADRTTRDSGFGDLTVRMKHNLWGNDAGRSGAAIMPFVTLPTGDIAGSETDVAGGIIVPFSFALADGIGLGLMTEIDIARPGPAADYEAALVNTAVVGVDLTDDWGAFVELFVETSMAGDNDTLVTVNGGLTYALTPNLQLDAGANIGVTRNADDVRAFLGLSQRY